MTTNQNRDGRGQEQAHYFEGETIEEVYARLQERFRGVTGTVDHIVTRVIRPEKAVPRNEFVDRKEVEDTVRYLTMELPDVDFWFNHRTRIARYGPGRINQFDRLAEVLTLKEKEVYGTFVIMDPVADFGAKEFETPPPFFSMGQFSKTAEGKLSITGIYRRQEMSSWWIVNIWELIQYQEDMIGILGKEFPMLPVTKGWVSTVAVSAHWRKDRKPMVAIPEFDQPANEGEIVSLLAAVFEESDKRAAAKLGGLLENKIAQLSAHNAPSLGIKALKQLMNLCGSRYKSKNHELYISVSDRIALILGEHEALRKKGVPDITSKELKKYYQDLARIFARLEGR